MPLAGGLRPLLAAIDDPLPADRSQFLLEFIRRAHNLPPTIKNESRDALLRTVLTHLQGAQTAPQTGEVETLPLPLPASLWVDVIFKGRGSLQTLAADIIKSRDASLLYYGLLCLDERTRAWLAADRDLLSDIAARYAPAFVIASPVLRITDEGVRVPGGDGAVAIWEEIVGRPVKDPAAFVRALLSRERGHVAYFYASMADLTEAQLALAFTFDSPDPRQRVATAQRLYDVYERIVANWVIADRTFWRPTSDPGLLLSDLGVDEAGLPVLPGSSKFWTAVFQETPATSKSGSDNVAELARPERVEFSWLCEQVFVADRIGDRQRGAAVLFASRLLPTLTSATGADALEAVRAVLHYPALVGVLERAGLTSVKAFADASRRVARLSTIGDRARAERAFAQYQGALALLGRAGWRRGLRPDDLAAQVSALSAIDVNERGDYDGRLVEWFVAWTAGYGGDTPADVYANGAGPVETEAIAIAAGPPQQRRVVEWEGTRYRVNFARAEALRLGKFMGEDGRPFMSAARAFVRMANLLNRNTATRDELRHESDILGALAQAVGCNSREVWRGTDVIQRCSDTISALRRAEQNRDARTESRLVPGLRTLADDMLARGLMELTYAVALGHPERSLITADDGARRHDFGLGTAGPRRQVAWAYPIAATDVRRGWHMVGSLLGLDVRLADFLLTRVSSRPPRRRPSLDDDRRRFLIEVAALVQPDTFTDDVRDSLVAALRTGRERIAALTPESAPALAQEIRLSPARATLVPWVLRHDRDRLVGLFSMTEVLWAGLEGAPLPTAFHAWGGPAEPRLGCLCLRMSDRRPWEMFAGRWYSGIPTSAFSDLPIRVSELLSDIPMPAALTAPVVASATLELIEGATMRDHDDFRGLIEFVRSLGRVSVEQYLALLTTDGPLVPLDTGESR
jgi:hypothetical protein